jgi:chloramphenicol-sensitive protein RarD
MTSVNRIEEPADVLVPHHHPQAPLGLVYGTLAYSCWGLIPLFFKAVAHLPPVFVLGHRILWSFAFFLVLVAVQQNLPELAGIFRARRTLGMLLVSAFLIATNWGVFIYAVTTKRVLDASLGYFIAPLVVVTLGVIVLRERMRKWQVASLVLALGGVIVMTIAHRHLPWIGLAVAFSFGGYGLFRKTMAVDAVAGLCVETALLLPIGFLLILISSSHPSTSDYRLLALSGPVTGVPLLLFTGAARRLRLSTIGLLQYIGPIGQFSLAVFVYHESFGLMKLSGFALIWAALIIYSVDSLRAYRSAIRTVEEPL